MSTGASRSIRRHVDWASLPLPAVDRLVDVLKRTSRWRCDGPSLRLLNQHWSKAIDQNVVSIRPHHTRTIGEEDILSLLKFPCLTSVDISRFLIDPSENSSSDAFEDSAVDYLSTWLGRQLERTVDVLSQLSHLWHLEMDYRTLSVLYHWCLGTEDRPPQFGTFRSLYCYSEENLKLYGDSPLNMTWNCRSWPQRDDAPDMLKGILGAFSSVNRLEVQAHLLTSKADLSFLEKVDSVELQGVESMQLIQALPNPSTTVSSLAVDGTHVFWEDVASLHCMKSLAVSQGLPRIVQDEIFLQVLRRLKVFKLNLRGTCEAIPGEVFGALDQLECLSLRHCRFNGKAVLGTMPHLLRLRLEECWIEDGYCSFLHRLENLESLQWHLVLTGTGRWKGWSAFLSNLIELPKLRLLEIPSGILSDKPLYTIADLTNLEVLFLHLDLSVSLDRLRGLEILPSLRVLHIKYGSNPKIWKTLVVPLLAFDVMTKLERLSLFLYGGMTESVEDHLRKLKERAPQLIIELEKQWPFRQIASLGEDAFLV